MFPKEQKKDDKLKYFFVIFLLSVILMILFLSCSLINEKVGLPDDNIFEEFAEFELERRTGIDIDLTPETKEKS